VLPFAVEERDLYAWRWVYDCRLLPMTHLRLLLPGSAQQLTRRAQRWFHGGYVDRVRTGYSRWVLAICNKGADAVCLHDGRQRGRIDWHRKNHELTSELFRPHTLSVARFKVTLELALRARAAPEALQAMCGWPRERQYEVMEDTLDWLTRHHRSARWGPSQVAAKARQLILHHLIPGVIPPVRLRSLSGVSPIPPTLRLHPRAPALPLRYTDEQGAVRALKPDWPFTLCHGDRTFDLFYEADRSTETLVAKTDAKRDMRLKLQGYWRYWQQTGRPFRVLTTCKSRERLEHLRELAREMVGGQRGAGLFWFTTEREVDPTAPERFWKPIWWTPKEQPPRALVDERALRGAAPSQRSDIRLSPTTLFLSRQG
jgi:hypothetical protein